MSKHAAVENASDPEQVKRAQRRDKRRRDRELADLATVAGSEPGARFLWRLLNRCAMFGMAFRSDALEMAFLVGQQDVGKWLIAELEESDPRGFVDLMERAKASERRDQHEIDAQHAPREGEATG